MQEVEDRIRVGWKAFLFALLAGISLLLLSNVPVIQHSDRTNLYFWAGWVFVMATIFIWIPHQRPWGEILVWNATGWSIGLAVLGLDTVGAMPIWPILLAALALTFWPRDPDHALPNAAVAIAVVGGVLTCWLIWSQPQLPDLSRWIDGL